MHSNTMYCIYTSKTNDFVACVPSNHRISLDTAISLVGKIHSIPEDDGRNVEIFGNWYYYDDLVMEVCHIVEK